jgi:hypothetical protein
MTSLRKQIQSVKLELNKIDSDFTENFNSIKQQINPNILIPLGLIAALGTGFMFARKKPLSQLVRPIIVSGIYVQRLTRQAKFFRRLFNNLFHPKAT